MISEGPQLEPVLWSRFTSQMCKLPNTRIHTLDAGLDGSLCLAYSNSGLLLACPTQQYILLYTFHGELYLKLKGHQGLIYNLSWSPDDSFLISASGDMTACVWDVKNKLTKPYQILSHPSFVYSSCWLSKTTPVTGCFDADIRVWCVGRKDPVQFLSEHHGRVNSMLSIHEETLISSDSQGVIIVWAKHKDGFIELSRKLRLRELVGKVINKLSLHPGRRRILVHTQDSILRMLDLNTGAIIQWYQGGVNQKLRLESGFCGCGSKVIATSEDRTICVWNTDTGSQLAVYSNLTTETTPAVAVAFHPYDHVIAAVSYSPMTFPKLTVAQFTKNGVNKELGLVTFERKVQIQEEMSHSEDFPRKMKASLVLSALLGSKRREKTSDAETDLSAHETSPKDKSSSDLRLADIIYQMDRILVSAPPREST